MTIKIVGKPVLLLVEGIEDKSFFEQLCRQLSIEIIEVVSIEGITRLDKELRLVAKDPTFKKQTRSLAIVRDADKSFNDSLDEIISAFGAAGFSNIPTVPMIPVGTNPMITFMLFPDSKSQGTLEDLVFAAFDQDDLASCVDQSFQCVIDQGIPLYEKIVNKARLRTFFALKAADLRLNDDSSAWWIPVACKKNWWPWSHPAFDQVKDFLNQISTFT